ncbi:Proteoglycan 4 [Solea senegalensis]|uniref:Proteoglycan 4 n=2 Tax=Solea senegalensis TaxID=28829 RepID=A0AAV6PIK3_SOLSE|nr:Proteoglycan 4 [Solea senegalensis]
MPELHKDMRKAPARDPRTRYRFFGYLAAYLLCIYGHRSGVLTKIKVKEVKDALGDERAGYLVNVMEHKTVRKFGMAQIYLTSEEYGWCTEWLRFRQRAVPTNHYFFSALGRGEAKDLVKYFRKAWKEMGLRGSPTLMDIRSAVATYNFESNDSEVRQHVATFMCRDVRTQERF